eukprot:9472290-Pyramimonas_sp.AAC.2
MPTSTQAKAKGKQVYADRALGLTVDADGVWSARQLIATGRALEAKVKEQEQRIAEVRPARRLWVPPPNV